MKNRLLDAAVLLAVAGCSPGASSRSEQPSGSSLSIEQAARLEQSIRASGQRCDRVADAQEVAQGVGGSIWQVRCDDRSYHLVQTGTLESGAIGQ